MEPTRISVVTTFNAEGYEKYGRTFLQSFNEYWPQDVALYVLSEDEVELPDLGEREVNFYNLYTESVEAKDFHTIHIVNPRAKGVTPLIFNRTVPNGRRWDTGYDFKKDAYKYSKKMFAIDVAARKTDHGLLIWLDTDTITRREITTDFIKGLLPEGYAVGALVRERSYTDTTFIIYNLDHPLAKGLISDVVRQYHSGKFLHLRDWHDAWVFDWMRRKLKVETYAIPYQDTNDPFGTSQIGFRIDHVRPRPRRASPVSDNPRFARIGRVRPPLVESVVEQRPTAQRLQPGLRERGRSTRQVREPSNE